MDINMKVLKSLLPDCTTGNKEREGIVPKRGNRLYIFGCLQESIVYFKEGIGEDLVCCSTELERSVETLVFHED